MAKSKFFRIAVEGATTDGHTIERAWIEQAAANCSSSKFGARVNLEHSQTVMENANQPRNYFRNSGQAEIHGS